MKFLSSLSTNDFIIGLTAAPLFSSAKNLHFAKATFPGFSAIANQQKLLFWMIQLKSVMEKRCLGSLAILTIR
jgi:predicted Zn-dependent protease